MRLGVAVGLLIPLLLALSPGRGTSAEEEQLPSRLTPAVSDQWQPETDRSDVRLSRVVSVWEKDMEVRRLLERVTADSSVTLRAAGDLGSARVTIFAKDCSLSGAMLSLSRLFDTYWVYPKGQAPASRTYLLAQPYSMARVAEEMLDVFFFRLTGSTVPERGEMLKDRIALYRTALALSPSQLIQRYAKTDPLLCAELLDPATAPMARMVVGLSRERMRDLVERGDAHVPFRELDAGLRRHLVDWARPPQSDGAVTPAPAAGSSDDWDQAQVTIQWDGASTLLMLTEPDGARHSEACVSLPDISPPAEALEKLVALGYLEDTPELQKEITDGQEAWEQEHRDLWEALDVDPGVLSPPAMDNPLMDAKLDLGSPPQGSVGAADLLDLAARQCGLAVVANYLPPEDCAVSWSESEPLRTLGDVLNRIRAERQPSWDSFGEAKPEEGGSWSWAFYGRCLVAKDAESKLKQGGVPVGSEDFIEDWLEKRRPVIAHLLEEIAGMAAAAMAAH